MNSFNLREKGGSQATYNFNGEVDIKIKGVAGWISPTGNFTIYDSYDLVESPLENRAIFVTTNFQETVNQSRSVCPGSDIDGAVPAQRNEVCDENRMCPVGLYTLNGVTTGECGHNPSLNRSMCLVQAWCPVEANPESHLLPKLFYSASCLPSSAHFLPLVLSSHRPVTSLCS